MPYYRGTRRVSATLEARGRVPRMPFERNYASDQSRGLQLWYPMHRMNAARVPDFSGSGLDATQQSFEGGNLALTDFGHPALNLNSGGAIDADYISVAAAPRLTINAQPFTIVARVNIRSLGLGSFIDFGRIFDKGGLVTFRFDAGSGSFGLGAGNRILLEHATDGTSMRKAGGTATEIPLNTNLTLVASSDGGLAHAGAHIWANGAEITYSAAARDGTGTYSDDAASSIFIGERNASLDRLFDGLIWDVRLYVGRAFTAAEARAVHDAATRYDLFRDPRPRAAFLPIAAGGAPAAFTGHGLLLGGQRNRLVY